MNLSVITYSSMGQTIARKLVESCRDFDYNLSFIGADVWFKDFRQIKINLVLEELKKIETEYTMYTDAPDSWFLRGDFLKVYKTHFKDQVVVSGNRDHYPVTQLYDMVKAEELFPAESSFRFVCSSQFVGPTKMLIELFEVMRDQYEGLVDQEAWHFVRVNNLYPYVIDTQCRLFLNMTGVYPEEVENWVIKETKQKPCSIHFGGPKGDSPNGKMMEYFYDLWRARPELHGTGS